MNDERWKRVEELFDGALALPPSERESYLRRACEDDEGLYEEVQSLLEADTTEHSLLDGLAVDAVDALGVGEAFTMEGTRVGPYRVVERIGTGGMGSVYLAERADGQFEQRVALKVIKRGMDSEEILSRFRGERQILAQLDHPNIARLLDGGLTNDGVPYFTMEYVDGVPIDRYCREQSLGFEERLRLFETVCRAVQHAQHNLVVHRDLKPSNILVTSSGEVKLLDFGIAKLLGVESEDEGFAMGLTRTGLRVMTPGYASPEQVRGEAVTTATDVYSLGVILYELLTGTRPYRLSEDTPQELERAIVETDPERPSVVVGRGELWGNRREAVRKRLKGDVDNIVLRALRKEPARRYASAGLLLLDLERYRRGLPVEARRDTWWYRAQKFIERNRGVVLAGAGVVVVVVGLVAFYTSRLARERDRARLEATKAAEVSEFLTGLFEVADPSESKGETVTARELLDSGAKRIETELADQPEVQATMLTVIGNVYFSLGLLDKARSLMERSLEISRKVHGEDHYETAKTMNYLAAILRSQGDYDAARPMLEKSLAILRKTRGEHDYEVAKAKSNLGWLLEDLGEYDAVEPLYRSALDIFTSSPDAQPADRVTAMNNLALLLHEKGDLKGSKELFEKALSLEQEVFGDIHPELATTLYNYAQLLRTMGDLEGAEKFQRRGLDMDRELLGTEHPDVAYSLNSLALVLQQLGRLDEAEALYKEALDMRRRLLGNEHPQVAFSLGGLARLKQEKAEYDEAEKLYLESLAIHRKVHGENTPDVAQRLNTLGWLYYDMGRYDESEKTLREALDINSKTLGPENAAVSITLLHLSRTLAAVGKLDEALEDEKRALFIARKTRGDHDPLVARNMAELGNIMHLTGNLDEATRLEEEALKQLETIYPKGHLRIAAAKHNLARLYVETHRLDEAKRLFQEALAARRKVLPANHPDIARSLVGLATIHIVSGDPAAAEPILAEALGMFEATLPEGHRDRIETALTLENCRRQMQERKQP